MNELELTYNTFDDIKHIDELGKEYWSARELMPLLEYTKWQNFHKVINMAKEACKLSKYDVYEQFTGISKLIIGGNGNKQEVIDYKLSRYACYLIAQNGDSRKEAIALAQTYFAVQTRRQELSEKEYSKLTENEKRLYQRNDMPTPEKSIKQIEKEQLLVESKNRH